MAASAPPPAVLSWNGISLTVPQPWQTIVRGMRHLIFEQALRPVLELRWEQGSGKIPGARHRARILDQLETSQISSNQRTAIREWVAAGGYVVFTRAALESIAFQTADVASGKSTNDS